jgi:hypothetical protein
MSRIHSFGLLVLKLLRALLLREKQEPEDFREFWSLTAKVHVGHIINLLSWSFKSLQNTHSAFNSNKNYELSSKAN